MKKKKKETPKSLRKNKEGQTSMEIEQFRRYNVTKEGKKLLEMYAMILYHKLKKTDLLLTPFSNNTADNLLFLFLYFIHDNVAHLNLVQGKLFLL